MFFFQDMTQYHPIFCLFVIRPTALRRSDSVVGIAKRFCCSNCVLVVVFAFPMKSTVHCTALGTDAHRAQHTIFQQSVSFWSLNLLQRVHTSFLTDSVFASLLLL